MKKENNNTILVTGSTGTVGSEVVKQIASSGPRIRQLFTHKIKLINSKIIMQLISLILIIINLKQLLTHSTT